MEALILIVHVVLAVGLVALILLQQGKGAEAGASFGGGASQTVFGSSGSGNFLSKITAWLAVGLFATSFALAYFAKQQANSVAGSDIITTTLDVPQDELPALDSVVVPTDGDIPTVE